MSASVGIYMIDRYWCKNMNKIKILHLILSDIRCGQPSLYSVKVRSFITEEYRFNFWWRKEIFVPPSALGPNGLPIPGTGTRSPEVKQPGHKADFSPPLLPYGSCRGTEMILPLSRTVKNKIRTEKHVLTLSLECIWKCGNRN